MPLDPFFADRLRTHRRYLLGQLWRSVRARMPWAGRAETATVSRAPGGSAASVSASRGARLRARHRRAALAWDRKEFETVSLPGPDLVTEEHVVAVDGFPDVRVRLYRPDTAGPHPAVLAFFGGAFRIGGIDYPTTDALLRSRAAGADVVVVAVDYALAPEHRFPTPVEQGHAALVWLDEHASELGVDPARVGVLGTSAGGSLAAAVLLAARARGTRMPRLQVLEVPVLDLTGRGIDLTATWALGVPAVLVVREMRSVARTYLGPSGDARSPLASPLRATDLAGLPPAVVLTAEYDALRRHGARWAARLREAGVQASVALHLGVTHDIPIFTRALSSSRQWNAEIVAALGTLHHGE